MRSIAPISIIALFLTGCVSDSQDAERCEDFQLVLSYVALLEGLSLDGVVDDMLPELIAKTEGPLKLHFEDARFSLMTGDNPDLSTILEICSSAGVELIEPESIDWSGLNLD